MGSVSIGKAVDLLARALRWSPVGRSVALHGAEGPCASQFAGLAGKVDSVDERGVMVIGHARRDMDEKASPLQVRLSPRHEGWTAYSLMLVRIAVVAELIGSDGRSQSATVAIASISRDRG